MEKNWDEQSEKNSNQQSEKNSDEQSEKNCDKKSKKDCVEELEKNCEEENFRKTEPLWLRSEFRWRKREANAAMAANNRGTNPGRPAKIRARSISIANKQATSLKPHSD
nr:Tudor domain-containing protein 7 [Ipomoea batatas]